MFSQDSLVSMANGTFKPINEIQRGDVILNKFKRQVRVLKINVHENKTAIRIQFNNGTNTCHVSPDTIVFCYYRLPDNSLKSEYCKISKVHDNNGYLKSDLKIFSPDSDIGLESYVQDEQTHTLYSLQTYETSQSYIINHAIVSNIPSSY
jgi:hypothetical protein